MNIDRFLMNVFICSLCVLGNRLLRLDDIRDCHKNYSGILDTTFCNNRTCDSYYKEHDLHVERGIKGLSSGVFFGNNCNIHLNKILISK